MKKKWDPQLIIAIGVMIISFAALFVSMRQATIMNKQTDILLEQGRASVWPYLSIALQRSFEVGITEYKIGVVNNGTGPAIIEAVRVSFDGKSTKNWDDFYHIAKVPDSIQISHSNGHLFNQVLAANEGKVFIDFSRLEPFRKWIFARGDKIKIEICYKSIFNEYWVVERDGFKTNLESSRNRKVKSCQINEVDRFEE